MAQNIQQLKKQIRTVKNIRKVTNALSMVAASKAKKYQQKAQSITLFIEGIYQLLSQTYTLAETRYQLGLLKRLVKNLSIDNHKNSVLKTGTSKNLVILFAPSRGFTGPLLQNLIRELRYQIETKQISDTLAFGVNKKSIDIAKALGITLVDIVTLRKEEQENHDLLFSLTREVISLIESQRIEGVYVAYPKFENIFTYKATLERFLPIEMQNAKAGLNRSVLFEPDPQAVIYNLLRIYIQNYFMFVVNHLNASEFSARMMAMKQATNNADSLTEELSLKFNKARQEQITNQIIDVVRATI